jgi:hypothetical protein
MEQYASFCEYSNSYDPSAPVTRGETDPERVLLKLACSSMESGSKPGRKMPSQMLREVFTYGGTQCRLVLNKTVRTQKLNHSELPSHAWGSHFLNFSKGSF